MTTESSESDYAQAVAIAQRKSLLFLVLWFPALVALIGLTHLALSFLLGESLDLGIAFIIIGSVLALLMWLVTLGKRYSKTPPKPAKDMIRVGWAIRTNPPVTRAWRIAGTLLAITTVVLLVVPIDDAQRGLLVPLSAAFAVWLFGTAYGTSYAQAQLVAAGGLHQGSDSSTMSAADSR